MSIPFTDRFRIRSAGSSDLDALTLLFDAYRQFYLQPSDLDACRQFLWQRMERGDARQLLAETPEGAVAGFVQLYPLWSSVRMKPLWLLNDLFVDPAFRSQGAASALLEAAKDLARETGACGLSLETAADNLKARALYKRFGFELETHCFYFWPA